MKKNLTVTLGGRSFIIDEDAYYALNAYIDGIRLHYAESDPDGEIVSDFESRIADLFAEETDRQDFAGATITIDIVRRTIERVGSLDSLIDAEGAQGVEESFDTSADDTPTAESAAAGAEPGDGSQAGTPPPAGEGIPTPPPHAAGPRPRHVYYRSTVDSWIGGVLGGLGEYLGMDAMLFRLTFIILLFTPVAPALILIYLAIMIFVPKAKTITQRLELHGIPVSPTTIWQGIDKDIADKESATTQESFATKSKRVSALIPPKTQKVIIWVGVSMLAIGLILALTSVIVGLSTGEIFYEDYWCRGCLAGTSSGTLMIIASVFAGIPLAAGLIYLIGVLPIGMILQNEKSSATTKTVSIILWAAVIFALWHIIF